MTPAHTKLPPEVIIFALRNAPNIQLTFPPELQPAMSNFFKAAGQAPELIDHLLAVAEAAREYCAATTTEDCEEGLDKLEKALEKLDKSQREDGDESERKKY